MKRKMILATLALLLMTGAANAQTAATVNGEGIACPAIANATYLAVGPPQLAVPIIDHPDTFGCVWWHKGDKVRVSSRKEYDGGVVLAVDAQTRYMFIDESFLTADGDSMNMLAAAQVRSMREAK